MIQFFEHREVLQIRLLKSFNINLKHIACEHY